MWSTHPCQELRAMVSNRTAKTDSRIGKCIDEKMEAGLWEKKGENGKKGAERRSDAALLEQPERYWQSAEDWNWNNVLSRSRKVKQSKGTDIESGWEEVVGWEWVSPPKNSWRWVTKSKPSTRLSQSPSKPSKLLLFPPSNGTQLDSPIRLIGTTACCFQ